MYKIQSLILILLCLTFSVSQAEPLFGKDNDKSFIWKSGLNRYIKLTQQDSGKYGQNDHPVQLEKNDIKYALAALSIPDDSFFSLSEDTVNIFTVQQIKLLSEQLPKGFRNARPNQDIIFVLEKAESGFLGIDESTFLAGRMFFKEGKLNLIIGEYEFFRSKAFESFYDGSGREAVPYSFDFGSRTRDSKNFDEIYMNLPGIENKKANKIRHDWFVIDLKVAANAYVNKKNSDAPESFQSKKLEAEAAKLARERRLMRAEMARMRKEMQNGNSNGGASAQSIEERIATLDQLLSKELISQEEYDKKREEILNDI